VLAMSSSTLARITSRRALRAGDMSVPPDWVLSVTLQFLPAAPVPTRRYDRRFLQAKAMPRRSYHRSPVLRI
jgi:hypothetical protein